MSSLLLSRWRLLFRYGHLLIVGGAVLLVREEAVATTPAIAPRLLQCRATSYSAPFLNDVTTIRLSSGGSMGDDALLVVTNSGSWGSIVQRLELPNATVTFSNDCRTMHIRSARRDYSAPPFRMLYDDHIYTWSATSHKFVEL